MLILKTKFSMKKNFLPFLIVVFFCFSIFSSCSKNDKAETKIAQDTTKIAIKKDTIILLNENFDNNVKAAYAAGAVTLSTGSWNVDDALIGNLSNDRKNGTYSVRIRNIGKLTMQFDLPNGAISVEVKHAVYGTDASSTWELWMSTDSGTSWTKAGNTITSTGTTLTSVLFIVNQTSKVRFEIRKLTGDLNRINIDDFIVKGYGDAKNVTPPPTDSIPGGLVAVSGDNDNMLLGNPSNATSDLVNANNYLMVKPQYTTSYSNAKHIPNWTSWHVNATDLGSAPRQDDYRADITLPSGWYQAVTTEFSGSGFDRGHMCPSADRTSTIANNSATFLMTNMIPQSPNNNQIPWADLENYCRTLVNAGNELYIVCGPAGQGGTGSVGFANTVGNGVVVPAQTWKIIVVIPNGNKDLSRITTSSRVIAILMPNNQTVSSQPWGYYRVSVDAIETLTGYDFLSNVPTTIQNTIEAKVDNGPVL